MGIQDLRSICSRPSPEFCLQSPNAVVRLPKGPNASITCYRFYGRTSRLGSAVQTIMLGGAQSLWGGKGRGTMAISKPKAITYHRHPGFSVSLSWEPGRIGITRR